MLDVHAPHQAVHTWQDFLIHIATISVGLLIAIGLEQTVEHFHHLHQLTEAREELNSELKANLAVLEKNIAAAEKLKGQLDHNMALLHADQTSRASIGKALTHLDAIFYCPVDGPWQVNRRTESAQQRLARTLARSPTSRLAQHPTWNVFGLGALRGE